MTWFRNLTWLYKGVVLAVCTSFVLGIFSAAWNAYKARQMAEVKYAIDTTKNNYFIQMVKDHNEVLKGYNSIISTHESDIKLLKETKLDKNEYYKDRLIVDSKINNINYDVQILSYKLKSK